jgi:hypothetical protein
MLAKDGVALGNDVAQDALKLGKWIVEELAGLINITDITLSTTIGKNAGSFTFSADVSGFIDGEKFQLALDFHPQRISQFIKDLFEKYVFFTCVRHYRFV